MKRTLLALGGVVLMAVTTGCGSTGHRSSADPTAPTAPLVHTTTSIPAPTTTIPNTTVVPAHITVPYVDAVLVKLNHVYGNAVRSTVAARRLTSPAISDLKSIYAARLEAEEQVLFRDALRDASSLRSNPGDPVTVVKRLVSASPSCVFAEVRTSTTAIVRKSVRQPADEYIGLDRVDPTHQLKTNGTPWVFFFDLVNKTPTIVPNQCSQS